MSFLSLMIIAFICTTAIYFFPPKTRWREDEEKFYGNEEYAEAFEKALAEAELKYKTN